MKIVVAHNAYQQGGGEDSVVQAEIDLLRAHDHEVIEYRRHNDELNDIAAVPAAAGSVWSRRTVHDIEDMVKRGKPDIIHVHNTFPLISPSIYWAAERARVPVVQTLHNFRLMCPQAMFLRNGKVCEDCLGKTPWRGVVRSCYRDSMAQSAVLATVLLTHRGMQTWQHKVTRYIALNDFCRRKFIEGGLPPERLMVKPNFVDFPASPEQPRSDFLFVGRLSPEKGVDTLVQASTLEPSLRIRVAGTGPKADLLQQAPGIVELGALSGSQVRQQMLSSRALVLPSIWYENFPRTLVEAFACGLPVIASRIGALAELVEDSVTGLLFDPGNPMELADRMRWAADHPDELARMGRNARLKYESDFGADRNYLLLIDIYRSAIDAAR